MTIQSWKEKIPSHITQVHKTEVQDENAKKQTLYKIEFNKLDHPGYIQVTSEDVKFIHYCEANANGSSCTHLALAIAVANEFGIKVDKVGFPKDPVIFEIDDEKFECVSEQLGLLLPVSVSSGPASASASTKSKNPAPKITSSTSKAKRDWKAGWNEIQEYLQDQGMTTRMIFEIREKRKSICDTVAMTPMAVEPIKPAFPYMGEMLGRALRHILMGKDLILVGEKGSGKDTLVSTIAWVLGLPIYLQTGNTDETKESIVGENTIVQGPKGMEVEFKKSAFATAVENGGLSHFAELNMLSGDVTSIFHSVLDDNRQLSTQVGSIKRHDGHIFIGSINQGDQYAGVKKLNGAFKDRCSILKLPYVQDFKEMLMRKTNLTDAHALDFLENVKQAIDDLIITEQQGDESRTVRGYIDAAVYLNTYGVTFETKVEVLEDFIINKTEDFEEQMAIRDMIRQKVWNDFPMSTEEENYINGGM